MSDKSKQRARALQAKTGMSYQAADNQLREHPPELLGAMVQSATLGPALLVNADGFVVGEEPVFEPQVEVVGVEGFDPTDFDKTLVRFAPTPEGKRPPRPKTLNQHIADRRKEKGWTLIEVQPAPDVHQLVSALMPPPPEPLTNVSSIRLFWDQRTAKKEGAR